jgi:hypothetical protein
MQNKIIGFSSPQGPLRGASLRLCANVYLFFWGVSKYR